MFGLGAGARIGRGLTLVGGRPVLVVREHLVAVPGDVRRAARGGLQLLHLVRVELLVAVGLSLVLAVVPAQAHDLGVRLGRPAGAIDAAAGVVVALVGRLAGHHAPLVAAAAGRSRWRAGPGRRTGTAAWCRYPQ